MKNQIVIFNIVAEKKHLFKKIIVFTLNDEKSQELFK